MTLIKEIHHRQKNVFIATVSYLLQINLENSCVENEISPGTPLKQARTHGYGDYGYGCAIKHYGHRALFALKLFINASLFAALYCICIIIYLSVHSLFAATILPKFH